MKSISLQITYRKGKPFAAYIYLASKHRQKSVRTRQVTQDLLQDAEVREIELAVLK